MGARKESSTSPDARGSDISTYRVGRVTAPTGSTASNEAGCCIKSGVVTTPGAVLSVTITHRAVTVTGAL